jgi:NADPH2:quinone reductase
MNRVVRIRRFGKPDVLELHEEDIPVLQSGMARIRHTAIGLNYLDIYHREGHYPLPLPTGLGVAGAGVVEAVGDGVDTVAAGDRVAYAGVSPGSYADIRLVAADRLVPVPDGIGDAVAAATLQQGITACFLLEDVFTVLPGQSVLIHAAAGGVGTIACQWAKKLGARVIGTVGSDAKAAHAHSHGCDHVIVYSRESVADRVRAITDGAGVAVVYDSVGRATLDASLDSLALRGTLVSFGSASGDPPPLDVNALGAKGSLYLTRPRFVHYTGPRESLLRYAEAYFSEIRNGLRVLIGQSFRLEDVADAHRLMESRQTVGSSVIRI